MPSSLLRTTRIASLLGLIATAATLPKGALAAQAAPTPPAPYPGLINTQLRAKDAAAKAWDFGVNVRLRAEDKNNAGFTDAGSNWDFSQLPQDDNDNVYFMTRAMPRIGYTAPTASFFVEGRSSYTFDDERYNATAPGQGLSERDGPMDLHQAYATFGTAKDPFSFKVGRQELNYGEQRIIGPLRWNNNLRTFDAIKVHYQSAAVGLDFFTGGLVYVDHHALNLSNRQDSFSGVYATFNQLNELTKKSVVEAYVLARNTARGIVTDDWSGVAAPFRFPAPQDIYTYGLRLKSKPLAYKEWDYSAEFLFQNGNRTAVFPATTPAAALTAPLLEHRAYAAVAQLGYTWLNVPKKPRFGFVYSYGSGDKDAADSKSGTFQNLFPTNHLFYGSMDLNSLQNMHAVRVTFAVKPTATTTLTIEGHTFRLDRTTDFWYNVAGAPRNFTGAAVGSGAGYRINPGYGDELGSELDFVGGWTPKPYIQLELGLSRFLRGAYVKDSLRAVGSRDASYAYIQATLNL